MKDDGPVRMTKGSAVYPQVAGAIAKIGRDISMARRSRRIAADDFAKRMGVSRATLHRLENGDPGVSLNTLSMAMFALGRLDAVSELAAPETDDIGLMLARQAVPRRVRRSRCFSPAAPGAPADGSAPDPAADENGFVGF